MHVHGLQRNQEANDTDRQRTIQMVWVCTRCEHNTNKSLLFIQWPAKQDWDLIYSTVMWLKIHYTIKKECCIIVMLAWTSLQCVQWNTLHTLFRLKWYRVLNGYKCRSAHPRWVAEKCTPACGRQQICYLARCYSSSPLDTTAGPLLLVFYSEMSA